MLKKLHAKKIKIFGMMLILSAAALLATGFADGNERKIEGSWTGTATAVNPPLGSFNDLITFIPKGGVIESRRLYLPASPAGALLETTAHGVWERVGAREYQVNFTFLLQGASDSPAPGAPVGTDNISLRLRLSDDENQLTGTFRSNVKDPNGSVVFTTVGNYSATRMQTAP